jgi:DNA repair exonuclease SbcCD ATPase subunit
VQELDDIRKLYKQQNRSLSEQIDSYKLQINELTTKLSGLDMNQSAMDPGAVHLLQQELDDQKRGTSKQDVSYVFKTLILASCIDMRELMHERDQLLEIAHRYESQLSERERKIQQLSQGHTQVELYPSNSSISSDGFFSH